MLKPVSSTSQILGGSCMHIKRLAENNVSMHIMTEIVCVFVYFQLRNLYQEAVWEDTLKDVSYF